ncbi:217_t:CDS:2, partial [Funneliformis geosporum]
QLEVNRLPGQEKILAIGYNDQPMIGFHTVENCRSIRSKDNNTSITIQKENFDGTSRQMEHAILLELLNDIVPLASIPAVNRIFADLKHIKAHIQEKIFEEIACGLIKVLFATPEKLIFNEGFWIAWNIKTTLEISSDYATYSNIVQDQKEIYDQYIIDITDIINKNLYGRIIIYYATHSKCEYLFNKLQENLPDILMDNFYGGLHNTWIMVATLAFVFYYCNSRFEYRQQLIWQYQAWPDEVKPPVCEKCDNGINRIANKPKLFNGKEEIIKLLEVVEFLTQREQQICPDDIVDVFRGGKTAKIKQKDGTPC